MRDEVSGNSCAKWVHFCGSQMFKHANALLLFSMCCAKNMESCKTICMKNFLLLKKMYKQYCFAVAACKIKKLPFTAWVWFSDLLSPTQPAHSLRSSGRNPLTLPTAHLRTEGNRAFAIQAPRLWNNLPEDLWLNSSPWSFESFLKTHFHFFEETFS